MKKALAALTLALVAAPATAQAASGGDLDGRYGTSSCYVDVYPPRFTIQTTPPFIVFHPTGDPGLFTVHCPLPPPG
ncbi:MAG: hypothetical protein M3279_10775 [Actinomycetota bacterium]|nr:hypothetical protein [Actinomycetota bacterium]